MIKIDIQIVEASELGLSEEGWDAISGNSNITFGDANRTLYTAERLLKRVDFENDNDRDILDELEPLTYIDLEN